MRRLRPDPIPADVLDRVLQAACWAPTGGNMQPWRIIVVRSPERKQALAAIYAPEWKTYTEFGRRRAERQRLPAADMASWSARSPPATTSPTTWPRHPPS